MKLVINLYIRNVFQWDCFLQQFALKHKPYVVIQQDVSWDLGLVQPIETSHSWAAYCYIHPIFGSVR